MDTTPATDADRRAAVEDLKHLMSGGHLSAQEFADRSRAVEGAQSLAELTAAVAPPSSASYGSAPRQQAPAGRSAVEVLGRPLLGVSLRRVVGLGVTAVVGAFLVFAGSLSSLVPGGGSSTGSGDGPGVTGLSPTSSPSATAVAPPRLHTTGGLTRFRDAVRAEFGSSRYVTAVVYPDYASIELPVPGDREVSRRAYFNGEFASAGTTTPRQPGASSADLRDVDVTALVTALRRAPRVLGVSDPSSTYVVFDQRDGRPTMSVYLSNRTNGTGYWTMRLDGTTVRTYTAG